MKQMLANGWLHTDIKNMCQDIIGSHQRLIFNFKIVYKQYTLGNVFIMKQN